eukprot:CAMPEP_0117014388 /NCGR_PEP_ID=MMETSP0472-20121206/11678_1 /TAXON_ID=693140 ORGANISM="Tiarina fusus, Strain LIS" /NCGR_SAMPLE_ID=MMETSP0472 /ASSEMBLY_ACC=CAM_ASM_000603 /LENGTH=262 /DNA_ID=CAMNT_0004717927 /DNA_START=8 /DNA_END=796 /DNA_ORIENTATION=+
MSTTVTVSTTSSKKRLEGLKVTDELLELWKDCYNQSGKAGVSSDAAKVIQKCLDPTGRRPDYLPLDVLFAMQSILQNDPRVEAALNTSLAFTPSCSEIPETAARRKFEERLKRLRLQQEESKYSRLTGNILQAPQDDINAKSMTYAASVGLNMIVAPLSFGTFMYFFAGGLFDYFLDESFSARTTGGTDIKRVIVGVVSGVIMLIIEMVLFVIRTHEFEEHTRRKNKKKKKNQPFGVYAKETDGVTTPAQLPTAPRASKKQN